MDTLADLAVKIPRSIRDFTAFKPSDPPGWIERHGKTVWRPWILAHLKGMRPAGHPLDIGRIAASNTGKKRPHKPIISPRQVWVEAQGYLVVVTSYQNQEVGYRLYKCPYTEPKFAREERFRHNFKLWEDKVAAYANLIPKVEKGLVHQQGFRTLQEALMFLGLDPESGLPIR